PPEAERSTTERPAGARRLHPRLAPIEPLHHPAVHGAGALARFGGADPRRAAAGASRTADGRLEPELAQLGATPRIDRRAVFAAGRHVLGRAVEADVEVIVVRIAGLAGDRGEAVEHRARDPGPLGVLHEERSNVLGHED